MLDGGFYLSFMLAAIYGGRMLSKELSQRRLLFDFIRLGQYHAIQAERTLPVIGVIISALLALVAIAIVFLTPR